MSSERGSMSYWKSLQRSLTDRADALMEYTESLLVDSERSDDGFARALKMCRLYTRVFVDVLKYDIDAATSEEERREVAEGHHEDFMERYARIDRWLSRGSQGAVPRALQTICRRQFDAADLNELEPVLTVGAPESFEAARTANLHDDLFAGLVPQSQATRKEVEELGKGRALAIISVPYLEGTRTLWYPITVGHEICHLRLARMNEVKLADLASRWIKNSPAEHEKAVEQLAEESPEIPAKKLERALSTTFRLWLEEVACDLNAVRLFGPAGARAIAEFLSLADGMPDHVSFESTHPPSVVRLEIMRRYLEKLKFPTEEFGRQVGAWPTPDSPGGRPDTVTTLLIGALEDAAEDLIELLSEWGFQLERDDKFDQIVESCVEDLLDGAPCGTHARCKDEKWVPTTTAHVVNAAWHAQEMLAEDPVQADGGGRRALLQRNKLPPEELRLHLDRLAGKAIDSIELSRLWRESSKIISPDRVKLGTKLEIEQDAPSGILSSFKIGERLKLREYDPRRLLVTPLFSDAIAEAGVDLRLGPDFIVFRHSATPAFDPLSSTQDPRMVQKRVTKFWGEGFVLHPNELVLAATLEYLIIPSDLSAQVITRSSYGRLGLMTATAVQIQPGSRGCITLELKNQGETPIVLTPGARVAQLVLWSVMEPAKPEPAKYWFPTGPEFSKAHDDPEADELGELGARVHQRLPKRSEPLRARFVGSLTHCEHIAENAEALEATDVRKPRPEEPAECEFTATTAVLAKVLQRWGVGHDYGILITSRTARRELLLRPSEEIAKDGIELSDPELGTGGGGTLRGRDPDVVTEALDDFVIDPVFRELATLPV